MARRHDFMDRYTDPAATGASHRIVSLGPMAVVLRHHNPRQRVRTRRQEVSLLQIPIFSPPLLTLTSLFSIDSSPSALIACADAAAAQILWFNVIKCTHADSWLLAGVIYDARNRTRSRFTYIYVTGLTKVLAFDALCDTLGAHFKDRCPSWMQFQTGFPVLKYSAAPPPPPTTSSRCRLSSVYCDQAKAAFSQVDDLPFVAPAHCSPFISLQASATLRNGSTERG